MPRSAVTTASGPEVLYRQTRRAALAGLLVTLVLGIAKLVGGWLGHSLALLSDSVHSLGDALSSASILAALWWAQRPADREHPYGHTRIETIVASNVALLLVVSGVWIVWEALRTWRQDTDPPHAWTIAIALVSVVMNEMVYRYSASIARQTGSKAIETSAWDQRLDVLGSLVVLIGLVVTTWGGPRWQSVDNLAALGVAAIVIWAGASLFYGGLQDLMDRQAEPELLEKIRRLALAVPGVRGVEQVRVRKAGLEHFVDIHVEVDAQISVREGHDLGHRVKDRLITEILTVKDVLVHVEPWAAKDLQNNRLGPE
ncbi:MAG TPA: cation diffusion facilitator family transporter [Pirellulales bacterium]|nr:cation diffusion facilitator family transporter [Pirellulales bacterium]